MRKLLSKIERRVQKARAVLDRRLGDSGLTEFSEICETRDEWDEWHAYLEASHSWYKIALPAMAREDDSRSGPIVGQVRRLDPVAGQRHRSHLVLVTNVFPEEGIAGVCLVVPFDYCPTSRDFILPERGVAIMPDAAATVWMSQLTGTPVHSWVSETIVDAVRQVPFLFYADTIEELALDAGIQTGVLDCEPGDLIWNRRGREAQALGDLAADCVGRFW